MDRKSSNHQKRRPKGRGRRSKKSSFSRYHLASRNTSIVVEFTLPPVLLNSGTTGTIASSSIGNSISQISEYSSLTAIFSEVKLVAMRLLFTPKTQNLSSTLQDTMSIGSRLDYNSTTTAPTPTGVQFVNQLSDSKRIGTYGVKPYVWTMQVPAHLEYTPLNADCPTLPVDYAGSPGNVLIYATNLSTSSVNYFSVSQTLIYVLKRRV